LANGGTPVLKGFDPNPRSARLQGREHRHFRLRGGITAGQGGRNTPGLPGTCAMAPGDTEGPEPLGAGETGPGDQDEVGAGGGADNCQIFRSSPEAAEKESRAEESEERESKHFVVAGRPDLTE
jgi:hypothetical protein